MSSNTQDVPGSGGGAAPHPLMDGLGLVTAGNDAALSTSVLLMTAEQAGPVLEVLGREIARLHAVQLRVVRQAEAGDIATTTGAPNATVYLRTAQRMSKHESSATVGLARDLDKEVPLTGQALAAGAVSVRQAQVIAYAIKQLPDYVGADERVEAEEFLIDNARFHNPDELRVLGEKLLERIAPEEYDRRMREDLERKDRKAEQKRSLRYLPNGFPQSESVHITLPAWEMELLRKIIEPLAEPKKGPDPDTRPIDQRRGDAFAEALGLLAAATTAPVRGGRPPQITVTIPIASPPEGHRRGHHRRHRHHHPTPTMHLPLHRPQVRHEGRQGETATIRHKLSPGRDTTTTRTRHAPTTEHRQRRRHRRRHRAGAGHRPARRLPEVRWRRVGPLPRRRWQTHLHGDRAPVGVRGRPHSRRPRRRRTGPRPRALGTILQGTPAPRPRHPRRKPLPLPRLPDPRTPLHHPPHDRLGSRRAHRPRQRRPVVPVPPRHRPPQRLAGADGHTRPPRVRTPGMGGPAAENPPPLSGVAE